MWGSKLSSYSPAGSLMSDLVTDSLHCSVVWSFLWHGVYVTDLR